MPTPRLTPEIVTAAIEGFESQKRRIDEQIAELRSMLNGPAENTTTPETPTIKRKFSAAARRKMALAQKARWAKIKGESESPAPAAAPQPKRKLSAAARAKLAANLKKARAAKAAKAKATKKAALARKKAA